MQVSSYALRLIDQEVGGLIHRLQLIRPIAMQETMVPAAMPRGSSLTRIDAHLLRGRQRLLRGAQHFRRWLSSSRALRSRPESVYRRYVFLRLQMSAALTQFDLFADAITQRSEADTGILLRGMEVLADDALRIEHTPYEVPALICYLDRGIGAAIRRARTRLPGGGENPVAIIRVPRERMVGLGIASSLVHEVGHQGAALLDLVPLLQRAMEPYLGPAGALNPWVSWHRWISEIVADLWSVARVGLASSLGLINVVSLPRPFVFRPNRDDPHPTPWLRVLLSVEMGRQLYPHDEWRRLRQTWLQLYPVQGRGDVAQARELLAQAAHVGRFVHWLLGQRVPCAGQRSLRELLFDPGVAPENLHERLEQWQREVTTVDGLRPCQVFALAGYARLVRGRASEPESRDIHRLLRRWALQP